MIYYKPKSATSGFSLIKILVVIIIIGILSAIALPSFLSQASKAKASEAKTNISTILKRQQAYYLEKTEFATNLNELKTGIEEQTPNYKYEIIDLPKIGSEQASGIVAIPNNEDLKAHLGVIDIDKEDNTFKTIICEARKPGLNEFTDANVRETRTGNIKCGKGAKKVGK